MTSPAALLLRALPAALVCLTLNGAADASASTGSVVGWGDNSYGQATPLDAVNGVSGTAPSSTRTTNLIERLNKRCKRRTKPMEIVAGENSVYTLLAFVAMKMEVSWRNAPFRNSGFRKLKSFAGYFTHES